MKESFISQIRQNKLFTTILSIVILFFLIEIAYYVIFLNIWFDEANYTYKSWLSSQDLAQPFQDFRTKYPPLAFYSQAFFQEIFGPTLLGARILSAIFLLSMALLLFKIGEKIGNRWTGLLSLSLLAFHPYLVGYYSSTVPYSLAMFFPLLGIWILTTKLETKKKILFASVAMTFSILIRYNMLPVLGALWLYIIFKWKNWKCLGLSIVVFVFITIISFIPYIKLDFEYALIWALAMFSPLTKFVFPNYHDHFSIFSPKFFSSFFNQDFIRALIKLFIKYFHLWIIFCSSIILFIIKIKKKQFKEFSKQNSILCLVFLLSILFIISHFLITPGKITLLYFLYLAPFLILSVAGAIHLSKIRWPMTLVLGVTIVFVMFSIALSGPDIIFFNHFDFNDTDLNRIKKGGEYLRSLTSSTDKILVIGSSHHIFLAERYTFPPLINGELVFYDIGNQELLNRYKFFNSDIFFDWLKNDANVVVFQENSPEEKGSSFFGESYEKKINDFYKILEDDFEFAGNIENVYPRKYTLGNGIMNIYKKK